MASNYSSNDISEQQFLAQMRREWQTGQHVGIAGPTGWGKTYLLGELLKLRQWVAMFTLKQKDRTIGERFPDFHIVDSWKDKKHFHNHVLVWPYERELDKAIAKKYKEAIYMMDAIFLETAWTYAIDDLNDFIEMGLKRKTAEMLRLSRSNDTSMVYNYQRPFNIVQEALSQATWTLAAYHKDKRDVTRLAEANGLSPDEMKKINSSLKRYDFVVLRSMQEPLIVRR